MIIVIIFCQVNSYITCNHAVRFINPLQILYTTVQLYCSTLLYELVEVKEKFVWKLYKEGRLWFIIIKERKIQIIKIQNRSTPKFPKSSLSWLNAGLIWLIIFLFTVYCSHPGISKPCHLSHTSHVLQWLQTFL